MSVQEKTLLGASLRLLLVLVLLPLPTVALATFASMTVKSTALLLRLG